MPVYETEANGWQRVGGLEGLAWRKSLRAKHWAEVTRGALGWDWTIYKADPVTMCPYSPASGTDISLRAVKEDVDHWNDHYHAHAVVVRQGPADWRTGTNAYWYYRCRVCEGEGGIFTTGATDLIASHAACEAAWQRGWQ